MKGAPSQTRGLTAVYGMFLIVLAVIPRVDAPGVGVSDWILHASAYGVFGGLLLASRFRRIGAVQEAAMAVGGAAGFGFATELLQLLIPYRNFEARDVVADGAGALVVVLIVLFGLKVTGASRWNRS